MKPIIVGIAGGTASGKTSVCEYLLKNMITFFPFLFSLIFFYAHF